MKRLSKILVAVAALCLLVGALALAISANTGVEGKFVVQGTGYDTWEDARAAANNTHTIYINEDLELDTGITLEGKTTDVKVNLNGKTVSVKDGSMLFNVYSNAKLTIEGEGTINDAGAVLIGASKSGVVTVNATGKGIVINHKAVETDSTVMSTFRVYDSSTLNVSGFITVNAYNGKRVVFNVSSADKTPGAAALNITDAKVLVPLPSKTPETTTSASSAQMISLTDNIDVKITDSDLELYYGTLIYSNGGGSQKTITAYKGTDADANAWKDTAAKGIVLDKANINIVAKNTRFFSDYGKYSQKMAASGHNIGAGIMVVRGKIDAKFDNCSFYADWRPFTSDGNITGKAINQHQLLFTDCHFDQSPGDNATSQFFIYAVNYKILGGTFSHTASISAGSFYYLPLENSDGTPSGKWIGGYMDNTFVSTAKTFAHTGVTGGWVDSTYVEPDSKKDCDVSLIIDGTSYNFKAAYFTDEAKYNSYFTSNSNAAWLKYLVASADGSNITATGDYINNNGTASGTYPFAATGGNGQNKGVMSSVLGTNKSGEPNGYVKFHLDANTSGTNSTSSKYTYFKTITGAGGSIITTDAYVFEFDVSTDTGVYPAVSMSFQGRQYIPRYDKDGKLLGVSNAGLQIGAVDYSPSSTVSIGTSPVISYNGKSAALPTTSGDWARITLIVDFEDTGVLEEVEIPVYARNGNVNSSNKEVFDLVDGAKTKVKATKLTKYDVHMYVDGAYISTYNYDVTAIGYGGYIPEGREGDFYIDGLRISHRGYANKDESYCFDNIRISKYMDSDKVNLGYLDENGAPIESIKGLQHFLVMPDNMSTAALSPIATVDGVEYFIESDAIAAIREGSSVKLLKDFEQVINAEVSFKLYPNGYNFAGIISATHKLVDYVDGMGFYKLVLADASELYTVNYSFGGKTATQTVAKGTVIPTMEESFPSKIEGFDITDVSSWTIPVTSLNDYFLNSNEIVAVAGTITRKAPVLLDGVACVSLEDAIKKANNSTVVLYENVTVDEQIYIDSIVVTLDLNGKTITAGENASSVFNVRKGSNFTITGKGTVNNVKTFISASNLGAENSSTVNVEADGATDGIVINHRVMANDTDNVDTFRFHDGSTLNVSGLLTVNACNGLRTVFNVYSGSGTVGAKALNINKAKVYVPLLTKDFGDETTLKTPGYSKVIYATDNIDINVIDSELRAEYGQIFNLTGGSKLKSVASYWSNNNWTDSAAKGVKYDAFTIRLNVKDSTLFSDYSNFSMKFTASGHNPGASIMHLHGKVDAKFDNCVIYSDFRAITSDAAFTATNINQHQILFLNCNVFDAPGNNTGAPFFVYGCNYKIIGGTWHNANAISNGAKYYLPLEDSEGNPTGQWVGGYMDGTLVNAARTFHTSGVTGNWVDSTYTENDSLINCSVARIIEGNSYTFSAAYYSDKQAFVSAFEPYELFGAYANTGNETPKPFPNFSVGDVSGTVTKDGGYIKHYFEASSGSGSKYNNLDGNNVATWNYGNLAAYVWEFDISTDNGWFAKTSMNVEGREKVPVFDAQGKYLGLNGTQYRARGIIDINGDVITVNGKSTRLSITKGEWTRISIVVNIVQGEERTENVPAYVKNGSSFVVDGEKTVDIPVVDITKSTISVYVDGILLNSFNQIDTTQYFNGAMAKGYADTGYIDDIRIYTQATKECSICYDNILFMPIYRSSELDLGFDENGNAPESIIGNPYFLSMPESNAATPIISVDGVEFTDLQTALAAIKDGSFVELFADVDEALEINSKDVKLKTNGKSFRGYISSTCKFVDYTAARGVSYSVSADADEIVIIEYPEINGISGSQTAVIGTLLNPPKEFDSLTRFLNKEAKEYHTVLGWTLAEGEDVQIVTAGSTAIPVIDAVKAVVVYWTTEDGNTILDTDFYFPGSATVLDKFDGVDLSVDHSYDYYGYGRSGWTGIEEATAGLATAGEYTIKAVMGKVAPDTFPGLKYNLMLCSNYVMNFYVPNSIEGISTPVLSLDVYGTALLPQFEAGTIDGELHDVFGYMLGIADTEIKTFYLVYNVGEDKIAFPVYVGVPSYADEVMKQYAEDTSAKGEAAKALVVNMANYATKVFALNGGVDVEAPGAKIYYDILAQYGEEYLGYYEALTNDRFAPAGDLYLKHQVSKLNWLAGSEDAGDKAALSYIKSIGFSFNTFEPAYVVKFSELAIDKGLQQPDESGATEHYKAGLHVYAGFDALLSAKLWAENGGNKYYGEADVWGKNGSADYEYFAMATNSTWDTTGANFNIDNIRNDLTIKVYFSENDVTSAVGEVNYNLAAYIYSMLKDAEANAAYIEAAKAIYAYSYVSAIYNATK